MSTKHVAIAGVFTCTITVILAVIFGIVVIVNVRESDARAQIEKQKKELRDQQYADAVQAKAAKLEELGRQWSKRSQDAVDAENARKADKQRNVNDEFFAARQKEEDDAAKKKQRMEETARRLGRLSAFEYKQATRAMELVMRAGDGGFDRLSSQVKQQAALIDPDFIADLERKLAERRLKK